MTVSRRKFVAGSAATIGGASLLPLLARRALASTRAPKRVVFWYMVEGTVAQQYYPGTGPGPLVINEGAVMGNSPQSKQASINSYRSAQSGTYILGPMKRHEKDTTLVSGLYTKLLDGEAAHALCVDACMTAGAPGQGSIDQWIGDHLKGEAPFHAIYSSLMGEHVGANPGGFCGPLFTKQGNQVGPTWNPVTTYNQVFPGGTPDGNGNPAEEQRLRSRLALMGSIRGQLAETGNKGGAEARRRLEAYLESIETIEEQTQGLLDSAGDGGLEVEIPDEWLNINPNQKYWRESSNFAKLGQIMMDTTLASLVADRTRVATMQWCASGSNDGPCDGQHYKHIGLSDLEGGDLHDHTLGHEPNDQRRRDQVRIYRWYYEQLAKFIDRLKEIPDGTGTLFDSTVVVVTSEFGGYNHNWNDVPFMIIGSGGGAFRTGQYIDVHNGGFRSYGDALLALAKGCGMNINSFGKSSNPLSQILA